MGNYASVTEWPAVDQSNESESSAEHLESLTKQRLSKQCSLKPKMSAAFDISSDTELKKLLRDPIKG